ncbi:hypothetical protein KI387_017876, partial [Taxus chinensis]
DVSVVDVEVEVIDWEADGLAMEVVAVVGMDDVGSVEVVAALASGGVGEAVMVMEVDTLI